MTTRESPELDTGILDSNGQPAYKRIESILKLGDYPEVFYDIGNQLRAIGEHREAISWYTRIEHGDCLFDSFIAIAEAHSDLKQWDQAAVYAERASAIDPDSIETKHIQFNILCGQGKMKEAEDLISAMENSTDVSPIEHSLRGFLCELNGDLEAAAYHLTMAIASYPLEPDFHARRALVYCNLRKNELALADVEFALNSSCEKETMLRIRSCVYLRTLQLRKFWHSQCDRVRHSLHKVDEKSQISEAIADYKKALVNDANKST